MNTKQTQALRVERALKLALEALESDWDGCVNSPKGEAITAIREALAEPSEALAEDSSGTEQPAPVAEPHKQQEPVAWMHPDGRIWTFGRGLDKSTFTVPLYTSQPASKPWVGLTIEDKQRVLDSNFGGSRADCMDEAEKILREKNA